MIKKLLINPFVFKKITKSWKLLKKNKNKLGIKLVPKRKIINNKM